MCMSFDQAQDALYATVEMEEVCGISDVIQYYHLVTVHRKLPQEPHLYPSPLPPFIGPSGKQKDTSRCKPPSSLY